MRNRFLTNGEPSHSEPMLSLEEEQLAISETTTDAHQISASVDGINDVVDKTDALEDVAVVADGIESTTQNEADLIGLVGHVVTGGQYDHTEVVPAMEQYLGRKVAVESIREKASEMYQRILKILKNIYERIEKFFHNLFGTLPSLQRKLKKLEEKISDTSGKTIGKDKDKFTLSSGLSVLRVGNKTIKDEGSIFKTLGDLEELVVWCTTKYADSANDLGDKIIDAMNDFEPKHAAKQATDFADQLVIQSRSLGLMPGSKVVRETKRWPGYFVRESNPIFGGVTVFSKVPTETVKEGVLGRLDKYRRSGSVVENTDARVASVENEVEIKVFSLNTMLNIVSKCQEIVRHMENYQRGKQLRESFDKRKKIEAATVKMTKLQSTAENSTDPDEKNSVPYYKAYANFNIAYANWVSNPNVQLAIHATAAVRMMMAICDKSLSAYE